MSSLNLKQKLYASASTNAGLQALLTNTVGTFQWADIRIEQDWDLTNYSAVEVFLVSNPKDYTAAGPMYTSWTRVQFKLYGNGNNSNNADALASALFAWLPTITTLTLDETPNNYVVADRDFGIAQTQPLTYQRIIDVQMLVDESI